MIYVLFFHFRADELPHLSEFAWIVNSELGPLSEQASSNYNSTRIEIKRRELNEKWKVSLFCLFQRKAENNFHLTNWTFNIIDHWLSRPSIVDFPIRCFAVNFGNLFSHTFAACHCLLRSEKRELDKFTPRGKFTSWFNIYSHFPCERLWKKKLESSTWFLSGGNFPLTTKGNQKSRKKSGWFRKRKEKKERSSACTAISKDQG